MTIGMQVERHAIRQGVEAWSKAIGGLEFDTSGICGRLYR
jgi:hypothetical protein